MSVEITARGGGYFRVYVNGALFSRHSQEREAIERATKILEAEPGAAVTYFHGAPTSAYRVDVRPSSVSITPPDSQAPAPMSDGGEDLVDFIDRIQGEPVNPEFIEGDNLTEVLLEFAERSKATWLVKSLYADFDGDGRQNLVAIGWRGYILVLWTRQRGVLKVGS